ncbi:MAG TPA: hypothetical protein VGG39_04315 [Polyangiaceae bacterium]|jgi:hypothetical protein
MRRVVPGILSVSLFLAASAAATGAGAQGAEPAAEHDARLRFQEGLGRVKARDFESARVAFAQAYAVLHKPDILWNLALAEEKSGHLVEALHHFAQLDRDLPPSADHAAAAKHAETLQAETGHIEVVAAAGALVKVDGAGEAAAPLKQPWDVMPGHHLVEVRAGGAPPKTAEVDAFAGRTVRVDFGAGDGVPAVGAVAGAAGTAGAGVAGGAGVTGAGGTGAGAGTGTGATAPQSNADPTAGGAAGAGGAGGISGAPPAAEQGSSSSAVPLVKIVTVASISGLAVVSAVMGAGFGVASSNEANSAASLRSTIPTCAGAAGASSQCQKLASDVDAQKTNHELSTGFWVAGGVLAAAAVGTWFLWPRSADASVTVTPAVAPGTAGLAASGRF